MNHRTFVRRLFAPLAVLALAVLVGRITDRTTGQPLAGLEITATGPSRARTQTDSEGRYTFRSLHPGHYSLEIRGKGVPLVQKYVYVSASKTTENITVCNVALDYSCENPPQRR
ncbi:MAG: carboxypeptidase-like regulatory domain-containing protein [Candidatus Baltobacteraceae bacterium]